MNHNIQPQYNEKSVKRFGPVLRALIEGHQRRGVASVGFNPRDLKLSPRTAIARLRDAVHSITHEITFIEGVAPEVLEEVWPLYRITYDGTNILFVSALQDNLGGPSLMIQAGHETDAPLATLKTDDPNFGKYLAAFALLLGDRIQRGQVNIIGDLSESLKHRIMSENDVAFISDGQLKHHMI